MRNLKSKLAKQLRICGAVALFLVIVGAGGCAGSPPGAGGTPGARGIHFADANGPMPPGPWAKGETVTFPIAVTTLPEERAGARVTVSVTSKDLSKMVVAPTSVEVTLPAPGQTVYTSVEATMIATTESLSGVSCRASRTGGGSVSPPQLLTSVDVHIKDDLFRTATIPVRPDVPRGGSQTFTVQVWPRGDFGGSAVIDLSTDSPKLTMTPTQLTVNLVQGATEPVTATVVLRVAADAGLGDHDILLQDRERSLETVRFKVVAPTNGPSFTMTASPSTVNAANNNPVMVYFTVTSLNNFSGDVTITYGSEQETWVDPPEEPFVVTVSPGSPVTFMRSLTRFFGTDPVQITFTGRNPTVLGDKTVTVTLNHTN